MNNKQENKYRNGNVDEEQLSVSTVSYKMKVVRDGLEYDVYPVEDMTIEEAEKRTTEFFSKFRVPAVRRQHVKPVIPTTEIDNPEYIRKINEKISSDESNGKDKSNGDKMSDESELEPENESEAEPESESEAEHESDIHIPVSPGRRNRFAIFPGFAEYLDFFGTKEKFIRNDYQKYMESNNILISLGTCSDDLYTLKRYKNVEKVGRGIWKILNTKIDIPEEVQKFYADKAALPTPIQRQEAILNILSKKLEESGLAGFGISDIGNFFAEQGYSRQKIIDNAYHDIEDLIGAAPPRIECISGTHPKKYRVINRSPLRKAAKSDITAQLNKGKKINLSSLVRK